MSRKTDPNTRYRVRIHKDRNYTYASVQETTISTKTGKKYPRTKNLGTLDANMVFRPNAAFRMMPVEERNKYIFPDGWDISRATILNAPVQTEDAQTDRDGGSGSKDRHDQVSESSSDADKNVGAGVGASRKASLPSDTIMDQYNNRLYGAFWLLEQISRECGLYDDLKEIFGGNMAKVNEVLSLAFFPYLSGKNYNRFARWQNTNKTLLDYPLKPSAITRLAQSITDDDRMNLIKLRLRRLPEGARLDCDSTSRSAWGTCLADIRWGKNKDNSKLRNTVEVVVYSLTTHEPVYYRSFPGNTSDMSTIRTILADLEALGIKDVVFITDRGYSSCENISAMVSAGLPFIVCSKTCTSPVVDCLLDIRYDEDGIPANMEFDQKHRLYYTQVEIPEYTGKLSDGTTVRTRKLKANLFLNPRNRVDELGALKISIEQERSELDQAIKEGHVPKSIKKYNAMFDYFKVILATGSDGRPAGIQYTECTEKIEKERAICGYFSSLMYRLDLSAYEALCAYKARDEHEKNFDQMKNQMHFRVQRSSTEDGKAGMSFILFVGLIPISRLRNTWRTSMCDDYDTTLDMLDEMEPIRLSEYTNGTVHMTSFTTKQVLISRACNIEPPQECIPKYMRTSSSKTK